MKNTTATQVLHRTLTCLETINKTPALKQAMGKKLAEEVRAIVIDGRPILSRLDESSQKFVTLNITLHPKIKEDLDILANGRNISRSALISLLIEREKDSLTSP